MILSRKKQSDRLKDGIHAVTLESIREDQGVEIRFLSGGKTAVLKLSTLKFVQLMGKIAGIGGIPAGTPLKLHTLIGLKMRIKIVKNEVKRIMK